MEVVLLHLPFYETCPRAGERLSQITNSTRLIHMCRDYFFLKRHSSSVLLMIGEITTRSNFDSACIYYK